MGRWRASLILSNMARIITIPKSTNPNISPHPLNPLRLFLSSNSTNRFFSALPSPSPIYDNDFYYRLPNFDALDSKQDLDAPKIPIKAYFLCTSIDLKSMHAENSSNVVPPTSRSSNYIALRFCNFPSKTTGIRIEENVSCCHYMVVFQYGSAVLFNVEDHEIEFYLEIVRRHASGLLPEMRKDDYAVKEKPTLIEDMQGGPDYIVLKNLDTDSIRIIGSVLGQSIALDYFVSQVDGMVEEFTDINRGMEKTGTFTMKRKKLFQLVGKANSNLADVILKVGLFDRALSRERRLAVVEYNMVSLYPGSGGQAGTSFHQVSYHQGRPVVVAVCIRRTHIRDCLESTLFVKPSEFCLCVEAFADAFGQALYSLILSIPYKIYE